MLTQSINFDTRDFERAMTDVERRQVPFATSLALNETAKGARRAAQGQMIGDLDRPTPFARRGVVYERSSKTDLSAKVVIHADRSPSGGLPAAIFLGPQVAGGRRSHKAFEKQLIGRGHMRSSEVAVPADRQRLDRYGNISQGQLNRIMSGLGIDYRAAGATRVAVSARGKARAAKKGRYFVPRRGGHLFPGIYHVTPSGRRIYPVILFVPKRSYAPRYDFHGAVYRHTLRNIDRNFADAWVRANRTARR